MLSSAIKPGWVINQECGAIARRVQSPDALFKVSKSNTLTTQRGARQRPVGAVIHGGC